MASFLSNLGGSCGCGPVVGGPNGKRKRGRKPIRKAGEWVPSFRKDEFAE